MKFRLTDGHSKAYEFEASNTRQLKAGVIEAFAAFHPRQSVLQLHIWLPGHDWVWVFAKSGNPIGLTDPWKGMDWDGVWARAHATAEHCNALDAWIEDFSDQLKPLLT